MTIAPDACVCCCHLGNVDDPTCSCDHCVRVRAGYGVELAHICECSAVPLTGQPAPTA